MNLDLNFILIQTHSQWIMTLNVKGGGKTVKFSEENTGENLRDLGLGEEFIDQKHD